ncbi:MAG: carboxylesterase/lipase family protein [Alphaproteobacteria bacterium]|nr:carboxylesterase/lipase family protein [Alphaproteobacteria bacterium]
MTSANPVAATPFGRLVGRRDGDLTVFRGVRYAQPPAGDLRFARPAPLPLSDATLDAGSDGPIPPQLPSRLQFAMGPSGGVQGEDCLSLTIWAPADLGSQKVPVLVWFHGGAFMSGAGSLPWYAGAALARAGRMVVVSVNSRLGALGYLRLAGVSDGNLGLYDQFASLQWVRQCIAAVGGDADAVCIAGQSAGAFAVLALVVAPAARGLFRRAILQSGPYGLVPESPAQAEQRGRLFAAELGVPPDGESLRAVPVERLLVAAPAVARRFSRGPGDSTPPFVPCLDGELLAAPLLQATAAGAAAWCDLIVGYTREECSVFSAIEPAFTSMTRAQLRDQLRAELGASVDAVMAEYEAQRGWRNAGALHADVATDRRFIAPALALARHQAGAGRPAFVYQFNWSSPTGDLGACHCVELPFLFGDRAAWAEAPMLGGVSDGDYGHISRTMRAAWAAFVRSGSPNSAGLLPWPTYQEPDRLTMTFDRVIAPMRDPAGVSWRTSLRTVA